MHWSLMAGVCLNYKQVKIQLNNYDIFTFEVLKFKLQAREQLIFVSLQDHSPMSA